MISEPQARLLAAIKLASGKAPCGICYVQGRGWALFSLQEGCGPHSPEFVYFSDGAMPVPLTPQATIALASLISAMVQGLN